MYYKKLSNLPKYKYSDWAIYCKTNDPSQILFAIWKVSKSDNDPINTLLLHYDFESRINEMKKVYKKNSLAYTVISWTQYFSFYWKYWKNFHKQ